MQCRMSLSKKIDLYEAPSSRPMNLYFPIPKQYTGKGGEGGELTRAKVRGAIVHKAGRKYQHDWLYDCISSL